MKVPDNRENVMKCICMNCPTYNECMEEKDEGFFCSRGKGVCAFEKKSCICPSCPITSEYDLKDTFYCAIGAAE